MDTKKFFNEVAYLKTLIECPDSFRNRRAVKKQRKVIDKMIKAFELRHQLNHKLN